MKLNKYKVAAVLSILLLILTPFINKIVNLFFRSGYTGNGFGSECLLWLFPILLIGLLDSFVSNENSDS